MNLKRVVLVISLALGFTGCAAIRANQTHWTEQLLAAAGFHVESVATTEDLAHLRTLKPRKVVQERTAGLGPDRQVGRVEVAEFGRGDVCVVPQGASNPAALLGGNFGVTSEIIRNLPKAALDIAR
jgi:hypothetical protein